MKIRLKIRDGATVEFDIDDYTSQSDFLADLYNAVNILDGNYDIELDREDK